MHLFGVDRQGRRGGMMTQLDSTIEIRRIVTAVCGISNIRSCKSVAEWAKALLQTSPEMSGSSLDFFFFDSVRPTSN